jgi:hypothetical protein
MHRVIIAVIFVSLMVTLPVTTLAQGPSVGVINGQVINGTEGGGSVAEIEVVLITYVDDVMTATRTARTDQEGRFRFDDVAVEHTYLVSAEYEGAGYYYPVVFEPGEDTAYVEVWVCDATTSDEAIRVGLAHVIITVEGEDLLVNEVLWLVNDGDRTYVGIEGVLVFSLPEGAASFEAPPELMPDYQFLDDNTVSYLVPFPPGERQLVYSYRLAGLDSDEMVVPLEINYPTDDFELLVASEGIEVATDELAPAEPVITDAGERFLHFRGENLPRDTVIRLSFSRLPVDSGMSLVFFWVVVVVVIAGIVAYLVRRRRGGNGRE